MTGARRPAPPTGFASLDIHYSPWPQRRLRHSPRGATCTSTAPRASSWAPSPSPTPRRGRAMNPIAQFRTPITLEDHQASRWVAEPLHLLDCCLVSNGGVAVVVTCAERAARPAPAAGVRAGDGPGPPGDSAAPAGRRGCSTGAADRRADRRWPWPASPPADIDVLRDVRLLHVHRAGHAGGLRLLRQGRGRPVRRGRQARRPAARCRRNTGGGQLRASTCGA